MNPANERRAATTPAIERVAAVTTTDPGIFLLAACSFIEGYMHSRYAAPGETAEFGYLRSCFERDLPHNRRSAPQFRGLFQTIPMQRRNSNKVRHEFAEFDLDEARGATAMLIQFCELVGIASPGVQELRDGLELWRGSRRPVDQLRQLKAIRLEVNQARMNNGELVREIADLRERAQEAEQLERESQAKEWEIERLKKSGRKSSERIDALRRELWELNQQQRAAAAEQPSADAALYLEYLGRFSAYTRSRADYERSVMALTPDQERVVQLITGGTGDFLVTGPAGTGKTLVLLHALAREIRGQSEELRLDLPRQVAMLTYTPTLVRFNRWLTRLMGVGSVDPVVQTVDGFFESRLKIIRPDLKVETERVSRLLPQALPVAGARGDVAYEVDRVIIASGCSRVDYVERGDPALTRLNPDRNARLAVWPLAERLLHLMEREQVVSYGYAYRAVSDTVQNDVRQRQLLMVRRIFVDEAQDLASGVLSALKLLSLSGIVLAGDSGQSVWRHDFSFRRAGIMVQGRSRSLTTNFRNTRPICEIAEGWRRRTPEDVDASAIPATPGTAPWRDGPQPEAEVVAGKDELLNAIANRIRLYTDTLHYQPENLAVLTLLRHEAPAIRAALNQKGIQTSDVRDSGFSFDIDAGIRVSSVAAAKGIEFPVVVLVISSLQFLDGDSDGRLLRQFRNVIYVGLTRAVDSLVLLVSKEARGERETEDLLKLFRFG